MPRNPATVRRLVGGSLAAAAVVAVVGVLLVFPTGTSLREHAPGEETAAAPRESPAPSAEGDPSPATGDGGRNSEAEHRHTNALVDETSPYLLQHAHNPVNWLPWGERAFDLAREQDRPIFLSIGYSTCYWCHVMERESFEDEEVAAFLNEHFVCIKVDREERPDVDEQYMLATQLMTGSSGWPTSIWLLPDGRPWMAGTYLPREQFLTALERLHEMWRDDRPRVERQAATVAKAIEKVAAGATAEAESEAELNRDLVARALEAMQASFDPDHGGFGGAPKFPPHDRLRLLFHEARRTGDSALVEPATATLDAIWRGGIHDHVGGGFHRYSTDERWLLPHFEKVLYDNAQLVTAFVDAWRLTGDDRYRAAVADVFGWLEREMTDSGGGFYSAIDSESDGVEGRFYVWSLDEIQAVLGRDDAALFADVYGLETEGNFTDEATGERPGTNVPHLPRPIAEVAKERGVAEEDLAADLAAMRRRLLAVRNERPFPHRDDKVLTAWNGLTIAALARAGRAFDEPRYVEAAARAADFLLEHSRDEDGTLLRTWRNGEARSSGYLDDHAFLVDGLLELHDVTGDERRLHQARRLADVMLDRFEDTDRGGFFFTSDRHEELIVRSKRMLGGGNVPNENAVAARVLLRLGELTGEERYVAAAERALESFSGLMSSSPEGTADLVLATSLLLDHREGGEDARR